MKHKQKNKNMRANIHANENDSHSNNKQNPNKGVSIVNYIVYQLQAFRTKIVEHQVDELLKKYYIPDLNILIDNLFQLELEELADRAVKADWFDREESIWVSRRIIAALQNIEKSEHTEAIESSLDSLRKLGGI